MGDAGAEAIGKALSQSKLTELYLSTFRIWCQSRAPRSPLMLIRFACVLSSTDGNQIGDSGADAIARSLKDSQLVYLYLGK